MLAMWPDLSAVNRSVVELILRLHVYALLLNFPCVFLALTFTGQNHIARIIIDFHVSKRVAMGAHFTVVSSVTWPLNGSEAGGDLVLIQTALFLLCKSSFSYPN